MMPRAASGVLGAFVMLVVAASCYADEQRKFEYKYSFKPPYLTKEDGTIPFWSYGGHAIASDDSIRITPSLKNKRGWVWTANATTFSNWIVELSFRITGRGRIGADGIAIWFTEKQGSEGPVYGSVDQWNGLGIFLDSYDNDQQHNNPAVIAVLNDGQQVYEHENDGSRQAVGSCVRDYRNKPSPVRVRIKMLNRKLSVWLTNGLSSNDKFEPCFETEELPATLPTRGYFGVSAATGALADDHDVQYFLTNSLPEPEKPAETVQQPGAAPVQPEPQAPTISDEERLKFEKEFEGFLEKLKVAKNDFEKEHGTADASKAPVEIFETEADRNVRQILAMQSDTLETVKQIHEAIKTLTQLQAQIQTAAATGTAAENGAPGPAPVPVAGATSANVEQMATLLQALPELARKTDVSLAQATLSSSLTGLRTVVDDVHRRVANAPAPPAQQAAVPTYDSQALTQTIAKRVDDLSRELSGSINSMRDELHKLVRTSVQNQQVAAQSTCSCTSTTVLIILLAIQLGLFVAFEWYQKSREMQAKKFY